MVFENLLIGAGVADTLRPPSGRRRLFSSSSSSSVPTSSKQAWAQSSSLDLGAPRSAAESSLYRSQSNVPSIGELNNSLLVLAAIFPDVRVEVFREMLSTFSAESRLHVVAEQLVKHKAKWVNGRWRVPSKNAGTGAVDVLSEVRGLRKTSGDNCVEGAFEPGVVPLEETFRRPTYKSAVRTALQAEFKSLSRSTIEGVLAEQNFSYSLSRPVLLGLTAKSWRASFAVFLTRWRKPSGGTEEKHFMVQLRKPSSGDPIGVPVLRGTGEAELEQELHDTVLKPLLEKRLAVQEEINVELASLLNEQEAEQANAMYECQCCFAEITFEAMAQCTTGEHTICFRCIQHAVNEALFGQSWRLNIDHRRGQVACLASTTSNGCQGCIPHALAQRAILSSKAGQKTWTMLEGRLADEALLGSRSSIVRCPFCSYAEIDDVYLPPFTVRLRLNTSNLMRTALLLLLAINAWPLVLFYTIMARLLGLPGLSQLRSNSLAMLTRKTHVPTRFLCRAAQCGRASCLECHKAWQDVHICYESATLSLRTTIEAARTAALKRTCPRCGVGFVKDSGCNKMICPCGYTMCYICRQGLGRKLASARDGLDLGQRNGAANAEGNEDGEGEGYRHFCQHFRAAGGRCSECERCDLYRGENEDEIVRRAGERAEREWRAREGLGAEVVVGTSRSRRWNAQDVVNWWIAAVFKC